MAMFSRLEGLTSSYGYFFLSQPLLQNFVSRLGLPFPCIQLQAAFLRHGDVYLNFMYLVGPYPLDVSMMLYLACTLLRPRSLGMIMSIYFSHTLLGYTLGTLAVSALLFLHCMLALCMIYVCVYIQSLAYGWSCTLYDGLSWLGE